MTTIGSSTPTYDANGNVTNDFLHVYTWDANSRPITIDGVNATYDALGRMVELYSGGTYTEIVYAPTGDKLALMSGQSLLKAFVPLPGGATAVYTSSGLNHYRHSDWLGSARLATTPSQTVYGDVAYAPYGETYAASGNADFSWTGINADVEPFNPATLYDFPAREYGIQGRWPSPDPAGVDAADPSNPQSWNRYAYVMNNPLAATDPTGLFMLPPVTPDPTGVTDIIFILVDIFSSLFSFLGLGGPPPPQAPPPPPGGYGTGIDPYGTWDEEVPAGVQALPRVGNAAFGNSFLGFHILCVQVKIGPTTNPPSCVLTFLGLNLGSIRTLGDLTGRLIFTGNVSALVPLGDTGAAAGPTFPFALTNEGYGCIGFGLAAGTVGKAFNVGQIVGGDLSNARNVLRGGGYSWNVQPNPAIGAQGIWNSSGTLYGSLAGTPGYSISGTVSGCFGQ